MLIYDITVAQQVDQICVSGCEGWSLHLTIGELLKCIFERLWNNTKVSLNETSMIVFDNRSEARCYWTCRITCIKKERLIAVREKCHPVGGSVFVIHGKVPRCDSMGRTLSYWWYYVLKLHFRYSKIKQNMCMLLIRIYLDSHLFTFQKFIMAGIQSTGILLFGSRHLSTNEWVY